MYCKQTTGGHVIRHQQSALQTISVVCWSRVSYQAFTQVSNLGQQRPWRACTQWFSCASTKEQALQLLAAVAQASETAIPVHAIEDTGMNFQTIQDGRKLTDVDIDAFQCLVHRQCAHTNGLQSLLLSQCQQFKRCTQGLMIQILYEATRVHWVLGFAQECNGDNVIVDVYDTVFQSIAISGSNYRH